VTGQRLAVRGSRRLSDQLAGSGLS